MSENINLVVINNPFYPNDRTVKPIEYSAVATLAGYVNQAGIDPDIEVVVSINGRVIPKREWTTTSIIPGAYVVICPAIQDGGGDSNPVAVIAGIALSVVTMGVGSWASGGAFWGAGALAPAAWTFGGFLAATATMFVGGMLLSHMMPQPKIDSIQQESPTYSWAKLQAMQGQGNPIAITYGTVRSAGQVLAQHVSSDGDKQYLNLLLSAGDGPIDEISDITINDNPAENYSNVQIDIRLGTNDQTVIPNFGDQFADQALSYELTDNYVIQQTEGNANQGLEITIECPAGLYHVNDNGSLGDASVTITADYRLVGAQNWTPLGTWTITDHKQTGVRRAYRVDNLPAGKYEVRVKCSAKSGTTTRDSTRVYWTQLTGIMYDDLCRPNRALIGIRALATDQLNGAPSISWIQKRLNVWVWNPNTSVYEQKPANNPAWAAYDLIHRAKRLKDVRNGQWVFKVLGASADRLIYQEFADWAQFCADRSLQVNLMLDTASDLWTALRDIENVGRGKVVIKGTRFGAICDKPGTPVQLFTMGNIVQGSFKEEFLSVRDRANAIEVTFNNKDKNYQRDTITVFGDDWNTATTVKNPTQISLNGITSLEQAYKEAKYRLRLNKHLIRTVSFEAAVDAIACQVGDVILVQHDIPKWGAGGRILAVTLDAAHNRHILKLDQQVLMDPAKQYEVMVRIGSTDEIIKKIVVTPTTVTTTDTITLADAFATAPAQWDVYSFGETNISAKPFRVVNITRSSDQNRRITALEYNEAVYTEATDVPVIPYTQTGPAPTGLSVTDQLDWSGQTILLITWRPPRGSFTGYRLEVDGRRIATLDADQTSYIYPIRSYKPYTVKVTALDGIADLGSISTTYTPSGAPPTDIGTYVVLQNLRQLEHYWTPNVDTAAVEIRRLDPVLLSWESGTIINSGATGTKLVDTNIGEGVLYFGIKAIGKNGLYSNNMKMALIQITTVPSSNIIVAVDELTALDGTCVNCFVDGGKITLDVAETWSETNASDTWNEATTMDLWGTPAATSATYTTQIKDMGKVMTSLFYLELAYPLDYSVEWRYSDTDPTLASATWQKFIDGGSAKFRYYQLRVTLAGDGTVRSATKFKITVDVPDIVLKYPNEDVPTLEITDANAGVRIDFPQPFFKPPTITGSVLPGPGYIIPEVYEDYCIIRATTNGSDRITGKLHIQIIGY